jgi:hypothetical protein
MKKKIVVIYRHLRSIIKLTQLFYNIGNSNSVIKKLMG